MSSIYSLKVGDVIGELTFLGLEPHQTGHIATAKVKCSCGKYKIVNASELARGHIKTCGSKVHQKNLPLGFRSGKLTIIETGLHEKRYNTNYKTSKCLCDCGKIIYCTDSDLRRGRVRSCGCLQVVNPRSTYGRWKCTLCNIIFNTRKEMLQHGRNLHHKTKSWNKGHTAKDDLRVKQSGLTYKKRVREGLIIPTWKGKVFPKEMRERMRCGCIKAHREHRANTWAMSRHKGGWRISNPEKEFMNILSSLNIGDYIHEYPFGGFSLDFAWVQNKKAIEIDGEQHYEARFDKSVDRRKENLLKEKGWKLLRIRWEKEKKDKESLIRKIKEFLGNGDCGVIG